MAYPILPIGEQNFAALRLSSMLYVDKTDLIYQIASKPRAYFLARPRRFGKSLLISTLQELFLHGVKPYANHDSYFKGLAIEKLWDDPKCYKVLHLNLRSINAQCQSAQEFSQNLEKVILDFTKDLGLKVKSGEYSANFRFQHLLDQLALRSLVLLIDEYDAPLTAVLAKKYANEQHKNAEYEAYALILRSLLDLIKDNSGKLRFALITGITYYKDAYLLTEGNFITDLSSTVAMSTICGYTKEEIRLFFNDYLIKSAALIFDLPQEKITLEHTEKILEKLTLWYGGYSFDKKASQRVFSPWSILKFFDSDFPYFSPYWFDSAGLPLILREALIKGVLGEMLDKTDLNQDFSVSLKEFKNPSSLPKINPKVLLYQTGYLMLKKRYVLQNGQYDTQVFLNIANEEIRFSLKQLLTDANFKKLK